MNTFLWGLVLSSALIWASNESPYFPIKIKPGDDGISKFEAEWYGKSLERMKEPRLPGFIKDVNAEVYRVMILPTWGNPIVVRVRKRAEIYSLSARRLDGQGGYDPGKLVETTDVDLNADDSKALDALIQKLDFFNLATDDGGMGKDGDESIIEGVSSGRYHVVQRWCATSYDTEKRRLGAFVALVRFLLDKSNLSTRPSNKGHRLI